MKNLIVPVVLFVALVAGCSVQAGDTEVNTTGSKLNTLSTVAGSTSAVYNANGTLTFSITLPSGQQYVELFSRKNGIQNVAQAITAYAVQNSDGTATYSYTVTGYQIGDSVEYRFYSYLPAQSGVFSPGPVENAWISLTVKLGFDSIPVLKDASLIGGSYSIGSGWDMNFGSYPTVDVASYHHDSQALFGFGLNTVTSGYLVTNARLVFGNVLSASGVAGDAILAQVDDSSSWTESTVTRRTAPAYTAFGSISLPVSGPASVDVTSLVSNAILGGQSEISFILLAGNGNFFIDSKENASGKAAVLEVYSAPTAAVLSGYITTRWYVQDQVLRSCFLNLNWTVPAGFENSVSHYEIYSSSDNGTTWTLWMNAYGNSMNLSWSPDQHITLSIVAVHNSGVKSARSATLSL